jgi:hypothetical protein
MIFPKLKKWARLKGWKIDKSFVYGNYNDYIFTAFDGSGFKAFSTILPNLTDEQSNKILEFLGRSKKSLKISEYYLKDGNLLLKHRETFMPMKIQDMDGMLKKLTGFFINEGICGKDYCAICGTAGNHMTVSLNDNVMPICGECYQRSLNEIEDISKENALEEKNYVTGIIGAFLGGLVGVIPWVIVNVYLNLYASILDLLIGKLSLRGYFIFKGKIGQPTKWIIAVITFLSVIIAELACLAVLMIQNGAPVSLTNYIISFTDPEMAKWVFIDIAIGLVMAFLGISSIFRQLKYQADTEVPRMKKVSM